MRTLRIATRKSPLALWQARHVAGLLGARHNVRSELVELTTEGDRVLSAPLSQVGGKGLFVKELEGAILEGRADLAVHSLKDMTSQIPAGLLLACVPEREDPRDAFVGRVGPTLFALPEGARVGTSSLRRSCQILERRPDLRVVGLRGNVQTRLRKLVEEDLAGAVLALAGLRRLGLESRITEVLEPEVMLPAVGQGALAIECREDDAELRRMLEALEDRQARIAVTAERAFLGRLEGGCTVPLAAHARLERDTVRVQALVGRPDGTQVMRATRAGTIADAERIGTDLADALLAAGAREILDAHRLRGAAPES
ncbi:MAG TPA: hydroxymethylbilane synthase [Myxococcaceae bacterium]|nr:hydroxymethylbilane synthase [Myxococcaceae bacterium]